MDDYRAKCQAVQDGPAPRRVPILEIWIDHGAQPAAAQCAYFVCMRPEKRTPAEWIKAPPVRILANTPGLMAVEDTIAGIRHAAFYEPGTLKTADGKFVAAAKEPACVMLVPGADQGTDLYAQDPKAGTTTDIKKMTDTLHLRVPVGAGQRDIDLDMPGKGCPDDRYRGIVVHKKL